MKRIGPVLVALCLLLAAAGCGLRQEADGAGRFAAVVQLRADDVGDFARMRMLAQSAKARGADLVIFPEESVFGWLNPQAFTQGAPVPGAYSDRFAAIARDVGIWVAAGLAEQGPPAGPGALPGAHYAYNSAILIDRQGRIVLHQRKVNVLRNAFDPAACKAILNLEQCNYLPGDLADVAVADTPFGKVSLLVCSDAFAEPATPALERLKALRPDIVIVPWGITAASPDQCGADGFNATMSAVRASGYLGSGVVGANAVGTRRYGKYLPSVYCGTSGYAAPSGPPAEAEPPQAELAVFRMEPVGSRAE